MPAQAGVEIRGVLEWDVQDGNCCGSPSLVLSRPFLDTLGRKASTGIYPWLPVIAQGPDVWPAGLAAMPAGVAGIRPAARSSEVKFSVNIGLLPTRRWGVAGSSPQRGLYGLLQADGNGAGEAGNGGDVVYRRFSDTLQGAETPQ